MRRCVLMVLAVTMSVVTVEAQEKSKEEESTGRALIEGVPGGIEGPACALSSLARALEPSGLRGLPAFYLRGLSGDAMLATVCQNNCGCRDYREMQVRVMPVLDLLGLEAEYVAEPEIGTEVAWARVKASLDAGIPVVVFNLFGDQEDVPLVGYDEDADLAWGLRSDGSKDYASVPLGAWRAQMIFGHIVRKRGESDIDLRALEMQMLLAAVAAERRPLLDGG